MTLLLLAVVLLGAAALLRPTFCAPEVPCSPTFKAS